MFEQLEETKKNSYTINEHSPEYKLGIKEGKLQERGNWVQVLSNTREIDETLLGRIIGEVAQLYEGSYQEHSENK